MLQELEKFIQNNHLFTKKDHLLVAVSGGSDSVCLSHALVELGYKISIAHCNFQLRGKEADQDEFFVKTLSKKLDVHFHVQHFDTKVYAKKNKYSIQVAARNLRYEWFEQLLTQNKKIKYIVTAHHLNDSIESFFINLSRGTGIEGLTRIPSKRNKIVRPMSSVSKKQIDNYLKKNKIDFRIDSSNKDEKYKRNLIRKKITPLLKELNPSFESSFLDTFQHLEKTALIQAQFLKTESCKFIIPNKNNVAVDLHQLQKSVFKESILYFIIHPFEFNQQHVTSILAIRESTSEKHFYSNTHEIHVRGGKLILSPKIVEKKVKWFINKNESIKQPFPLSIREIKYKKNINLKTPSHIALLDASTLKFPLTLRKWKQGDKFKPIGLHGFKKMSDFFISQKMSQLEKQNTFLLCSEGKIIWVVGKRIDDRNKITEKTKNIIELIVENV